MELFKTVCGTWEKHLKTTKHYSGLIGPAPLLVKATGPNHQQGGNVSKLDNEEKQLVESMLKKSYKKPEPLTNTVEAVSFVSEFDE